MSRCISKKDMEADEIDETPSIILRKLAGLEPYFREEGLQEVYKYFREAVVNDYAEYEEDYFLEIDELAENNVDTRSDIGMIKKYVESIIFKEHTEKERCVSSDNDSNDSDDFVPDVISMAWKNTEDEFEDEFEDDSDDSDYSE